MTYPFMTFSEEEQVSGTGIAGPASHRIPQGGCEQKESEDLSRLCSDA